MNKIRLVHVKRHLQGKYVRLIIGMKGKQKNKGKIEIIQFIDAKNKEKN